MTKRTLPDNAVMIPTTAEKVFSGQIFDVYQWRQEMFDGTFQIFEMLKRPDSVQVIVIDSEGKVVLVSEEQPGGIHKTHCPGGRVDPEDESVLDAAKRELEEETGFKMKNWRLIDVVQPQSKIEWFIHTFVAWDVEEVVPTRHDAGERIVIERSAFKDVKKILAKWAPSIKTMDSTQELIEVKD